MKFLCDIDLNVARTAHPREGSAKEPCGGVGAEPFQGRTAEKGGAWVNDFDVRRQACRFLVVGAGTVLLDYLVLFVLTAVCGVRYLVSAGVSFMLASTCNYVLSIRWVFIPGRFSPSVEFSIFILTSAVGLLINQVAMWVLVDLFFFNYLFAKLISIGGVTVWNFVSKKKLVFTR